jgi:hypothetical protein
LDRLCRSIFLEMSCLGTRVPADPNEVEHHLVAEWCVAVKCSICGTAYSCSLGDWFCLKKPSYTTRAFLHSCHFTNNCMRNVKMAASAICWRQKKTSRVLLWSAANRLWLAQFVCPPQFFKTPKGLCGHIVYTHAYTVCNLTTQSISQPIVLLNVRMTVNSELERTQKEVFMS